MPFSRPSLTDILARVRSGILSRLTTEMLRRSDAEVYARVVAGASHELHGHLQFIQQQVIYDTAEAEFLDRWASIWLTTPRLPAVSAHGQVQFSGINGSVIPAATVIVRSDGAEFETDASAIIAGGVATVAVTASTPGQAGNTADSTILTLSAPITGVDSNAVVDSAAVVGGADREDDASLAARLRTRIQQPPHGGAAHDYIAWALEVPGVTRAWVSPLELGLGTVTVRFVRDNDTPSIIPDSGEVQDVQDHIDAVRPVTADVTVVAPIPVPLDFTIEVFPDTPEVRAAVEAELTDLLQREPFPGGTILISHIREAISIAAGENNHVLSVPSADVTHSTGEIAVMGTITWV